MLIKFGVVVVLSPIFFVPGIVLVVIGGGLSQIYMTAQLSIKREMANARAPVLAQSVDFISALSVLCTDHCFWILSFGASVSGLS